MISEQQSAKSIPAPSWCELGEVPVFLPHPQTFLMGWEYIELSFSPSDLQVRNSALHSPACNLDSLGT